ncbi:hypothetical protein ANN_04327 [Periplaneta americana]|uniref:DUF4817 domain-containing protein n=1 Tax=Periplaneta americana TaxID=6978 RepID=A0ABQ8T891_PERAM|nr:hypothetical protein ANN_04327 [Periplaneta americana]
MAGLCPREKSMLSLPSKETLRGHSDSSFRGEGYIQCCVGVRLCDMYSNQELAEIHFMYGKADSNAALARRLYQGRYPQRQCPDRKTFVRFSLNMWAGIIGDRLVGPHVLVNRLTRQAYTNFLENTIPHVLEDTPLINRQHIHFLHGGAPAHFSRTARRYLDRRFPDRWIGRGGPIAWPPRSPDLNPLDFYLWCHLKSLVYSSPVPDLESFRNRIVACSEDICNTPGVWDRVRRSMRHRCEVCIQAGGGNILNIFCNDNDLRKEKRSVARASGARNETRRIYGEQGEYKSNKKTRTRGRQEEEEHTGWKRERQEGQGEHKEKKGHIRRTRGRDKQISVRILTSNRKLLLLRLACLYQNYLQQPSGASKRNVALIATAAMPGTEVTDLPCHTQAVERCVKVVTDAAKSVPGQEIRVATYEQDCDQEKCHVSKLSPTM